MAYPLPMSLGAKWRKNLRRVGMEPQMTKRLASTKLLCHMSTKVMPARDGEKTYVHTFAGAESNGTSCDLNSGGRRTNRTVTCEPRSRAGWRDWRRPTY